MPLPSHSPGNPHRRPFAALLALVAGTLALAGASPRPAAAALPPGGTPCLTEATPAGYGSFLLLKHESFRQAASGAPSTDGAVVEIRLVPPSAYSISNAILAGPANTRVPLTRQADGSSTVSEAGAATTILARYGAGAWNASFQLGFTNGDSFIGFFPFLLASNVPPVPAVANLTEAQAINPRNPFSLAWTPWVGATTNDRIQLTVSDAAGAVVFSAATDCAGQTNLPTGATSVVIPAGRLAANTTYTGHLTLGARLLRSQDDSTLIAANAFESRTTRFTLKTSAATSEGSPGTFQNPTVSGTNLVFVLRGTAGDTQRIESTTDFLTWATVREVTLPAGGTLEVTLPLPADGTPRFYRAVAVGGTAPPAGDPATLAVVVRAARELDVTVTGTPGVTYTVERTLDGLTWTNVATATIPADGTPQVVYVTVPPTADYILVRAVIRPVAPPAPLLAPTLAATLNTNGGGFTSLRISLTGGTPRKNYILQQRSAAAPNAPWVNLGQSISTDVNGNGITQNIFVGRFPGPGGGAGSLTNIGFQYRAFIR